MKFLNNYSNRELNIWAELALNILVSLYFISKIYPLLINDQFNSEALLPIIFTTIIIAIIYSIIVFGVINIFTKREEKDERDYFYELTDEIDINESGMKGIVVGDVDNNGYPDILKWRYYETSNHRLLLNFGNHHFECKIAQKPC